MGEHQEGRRAEVTGAHGSTQGPARGAGARAEARAEALAAPQAASDWEVLFELLPAVSRTFALGIAQLEEGLREPVCAAYLLCRAADTIEDAEALTPAEKAAWMERLCADVEAGGVRGDWPARAAAAVAQGTSPHELRLLLHLPQLLRAVEALPAAARGSIRRCVLEMATGMVEMQHVLWAHRQDGPAARPLPTLPTLPSLRRYCHYVAGTVGTLLTELFLLTSPRVDKHLYFELLERAEPFAQVLQHINILKDVAEDQAAGRCYVPLEALAREGLTPASLLAPGSGAAAVRALGPVMASVLRQGHAAHEYLERIPVEEGRVRRFLAYSLYFGVDTLALALREPARMLGHGPPLKIPREQVAAVMELLERTLESPRALAAEYRRRVAALGEGLHPDWPPEVVEALASWQEAAHAAAATA
jgi:farnesyl-diphosphate farnesyltransferase